ncbi:MAG: 4Fe-4S cluster-binding domain-containing protein [Bacteroidetes bacterium]|nr:4Fe-4S cluster-binding domain-containing protein [Bacteroidota bacterium]
MSYSSYLNDLVNKNHQTFKQHSNIQWINSYRAMDLENHRNLMINSFSDKVKWSFKETKPWINSISRGCQLCGEGQWSCLFITGLCNAHCFYCPTSQKADHLPTTQQLEFSNPHDYAAYINKFEFKGVSFSGGEPLLFFDRLLDFITTIRTQCAPELYIWMYTNGKLFTREKAEILGKLGLDEIRFDIGATQYNIDTIHFAKGLILNITVEIPAVPEKKDFIKTLLPALMEAGVTNINLHQMRLTEHNVSKLKKHPYTYLHGEAPTVVDSELAALELINFVDENQLTIGINYCGFQYKNRFQKSGYRLKLAQQLIGPPAWITEAGYIGQMIGFTKETPEEPKLLTLKDFIGNSHLYHQIEISFFGVVLQEKREADSDVFEIKLGEQSYVVRQKTAGSVLIILNDDFEALIQLLSGQNPNPPEKEDLFTIWKHTVIETGFREYM